MYNFVAFEKGYQMSCVKILAFQFFWLSICWKLKAHSKYKVCIDIKYQCTSSSSHWIEQSLIHSCIELKFRRKTIEYSILQLFFPVNLLKNEVTYKRTVDSIGDRKWITLSIAFTSKFQ